MSSDIVASSLEPTIGPTPQQQIQQWAEAAGVAREASFASFALRLRTDLQMQLHRTILDSISKLAPVFSRWEVAGKDTLGLATLGLAWNRRPAFLDTAIPQPSGLTHPPNGRGEFEIELRDGKLSLEEDALYLLLHCQIPVGDDEDAQRQLRAWVLLKSWEMARDQAQPDRYAARACRALRLAAYELPEAVDTRRAFVSIRGTSGTSQKNWRQVFKTVCPGVFTFSGLTEQLKAYWGRTSPKRLPADCSDTQGSAVAALAALAAGKTSAFPLAYDDRVVLPVAVLEWARIDRRISPGDTEARIAVEAPIECPLLDRQPSHDDEDGTAFIPIDPSLSVGEQSIHVQSVRLQLGADARFLPWDWPKPTRVERRRLDTLVAAALTEPATDDARRLLAALVHLAIVTGQSLDGVALLPLGASLDNGADWTLDLPAGALRRLAPRRFDRWRPSDGQFAALRSAAHHVSIPIQPAACAALRSAYKQAQCSKLVGQLWHARLDTPLRTAFHLWIREDPLTSRLESGMLARIAGQQAYEATHDHVLARLIASTQTSALPASTLYTAFHEVALQQIYPSVGPLPSTLAGKDTNVAGSLLDPNDDGFLRTGFTIADESVHESVEAGDWQAYHNRVAAVWDAALRAATGARPVKSLWRSLDDFDFDERFVFVDDKASPLADSGRLVPLPIGLCNDFRAHYCDQHLPWVQRQLALSGKPVICDDASPPGVMFKIEQGAGSLRLSSLDAESRGMVKIESPLPLNVFRHRLRTMLHQNAANTEIVDAVLGHGDGATLTHGDHSMRIWQADAEAIRPAMTEAFDKLGFVPPPRWARQMPVEPCVADGAKAYSLPCFSGRQPNKGKLSEREAAIQTIDDFLADASNAPTLPSDPFDATSAAAASPPDRRSRMLRDLARLGETQLDELSKTLLSQGTNAMPSTGGALRYDTLLQLADEAWTELGCAVRFAKRYSSREIEQSPFSHLAPGSLATLARLREALSEMMAREKHRSRIGLGEALALAVFDLCLTSRISHLELLHTVLDEEDPWRVVKMDQCFYFEWNPGTNLRESPRAPVQRFAISRASAWFLQSCIRNSSRRKVAWTNALSFSGALVGAFSAGTSGVKIHSTTTELLEALCCIVAQCNIIEYPGTVAGYLGGRVHAASLGWPEWIRATKGLWVDASALYAEASREKRKRKREPEEFAEDQVDEIEPHVATRFIHPSRRTNDASQERVAAYELVSEVRRVLAKIEMPKGSKRRANEAEMLSRTIRGQSAEVSSAIHLLCLWSIDLLLRPGRSRKLASSSVLKYFGTLSPAFLNLGCRIDLANLDAEEIEEFYSNLLDVTTAETPFDVYQRLRSQFHNFARSAAGLPEINWSALTSTRRPSLGAPGRLDEATYQLLLERLAGDHRCAGVHPWQLQCFMILAYRFGLRGGEIAGLRKDDFLPGAESSPVIVRNNMQRTLKTKAARRIVPLLFALSELEHLALTKLSSHQRFGTIGAENPPLFGCDHSPSEILDGMKIRAHLNAVIKETTGQPELSLHHLRHSFCDRIWRITQTSASSSSSSPSDPEERQRILDLLLGPGSHEVNRRIPWAIARLMGHAFPGTSTRNYVHSVGDVAADLVSQRSNSSWDGVAPDSIPGVVDLNRNLVEFIPRDTGSDHESPSVGDPRSGLQALFRLSRGLSASEAAADLGIPVGPVEELQAAADGIYSALERTASPPSRLSEKRKARLSQSGLLSLLPIGAHDRLRTALLALTAEQLTQVRSLHSIAPQELIAMFGPKKEIMMWDQHHFKFVGLSARCLIEDKRRLTLQMTQLSKRRHADGTPADNPMEATARATGWLQPQASAGASAGGVPALCESILAVESLPKVWLRSEGLVVEQRAAVLLAKGESTINRMEFAVALLCLNVLTKGRVTS